MLNMNKHKNKALYTYRIKNGQKTRLITTYCNNSMGQKLRLNHQQILQQLDFSIFDLNLTYAYIPSQNIRSLVNKHLDSKYFLTCDIKSFFDSIDHQILNHQLKEHNLDNLITNDILQQLSCNKQHRSLGIGMILSPFLSNLYLLKFDKLIFEYCQSRGIIYTRYADDLSFSALNEFNSQELLAYVNTQLETLHLKLNTNKTHVSNLINKYSSIKLLGLNIVNGRDTHYITVSRGFKKNLQNETNLKVKHAKQSYINYNEHNYMI